MSRAHVKGASGVRLDSLNPSGESPSWPPPLPRLSFLLQSDVPASFSPPGAISGPVPLQGLHGFPANVIAFLFPNSYPIPHLPAHCRRLAIFGVKVPCGEGRMHKVAVTSVPAAQSSLPGTHGCSLRRG